MALKFVRLGDAATGSFYCPINKISVNPGETVDMEEAQSYYIEKALAGGHIVEISEAAWYAEAETADIVEADLVAFVAPYLSEGDEATFLALSAANKLITTQDIIDEEALMDTISGLTCEETEILAADHLSGADKTTFDAVDLDSKDASLEGLARAAFDPFANNV